MLTRAPMMAFIATDDAGAALGFYRDTLRLTLVADEPFALVFDAAGTTLRVQKVAAVTPPAGTALGWRVGNIQTAMADLLAAGVAFERFPSLPQDAQGVMTFPDGAQVAWFRDPAGNLLSLTQEPA